MTDNFPKPIDGQRQLLAWVRSYSGKALSQAPIAAQASRSYADALAAWQKWHLDPLAPGLPEFCKPWYVALERARVETLAGCELDGVRTNLALSAGFFGHLSPQNLYLQARRAFADRCDESSGFSSQAGVALQPFGVWGRFWRFTGIKTVQPSRIWVEWQLSNARQHISNQESFQDEISTLIEALPRWVDTGSSDDEGLVFTAVQAADLSAAADSLELGDDDPGGDPGPGAAGQDRHSDLAACHYAAFSREFDQVGPAQKWLEVGDRALLRLLESSDRKRVQHIARQLQRQLLARACPRWDFDCTEGVLDSRRLSRLITAPDDRRVFRQEVEREEDQACVCFLVDVSGSMRRERRIMAALTLDLVLQTLDQCSINAEALAFTTRYFHPNPIVESWQTQGLPPRPGRLNALRHIVLKEPKQRWRTARESLALLLKDDFGCENLDGEALDWAAKRLSARPEQRKLLVVLSDGEPYDEATAHANGPLYVEDHLRHVISAIEDSSISLSAIGFGSQVGRFYRNSLSVARVDDLPCVIFDRVGELLLTKAKRQH